MKKLVPSLAALLCASVFSGQLKAETIAWHFDSPEEIARFNPLEKDPAARFAKEQSIQGGGAIKGPGFSFKAPKEFTEGVLSFWVYDDFFEQIPEDQRRTIYVTFNQETGGKKQTARVELRRFSEGWRMAFPGESPTSLYYAPDSAPNHGGWTRFDIVNPPGQGPKAFRIYIDGYEALRTPEQYLSIAGMSASNLPYIDELVYDSDPGAFHPNPVRQILPGEPYGQVLLQKDGKLKAELELDPKGARAESGELTAVLLSGRCEPLVSATTTVDWKKGETKKLTVELPTPPRSGVFWLETRYREANGPVETSRRRINVQFLTAGFAQADRQPLELFRRSWDFLPIGKRELVISGPNQTNGPSKADLAVPAAAPADWSQAATILGVWLDFGSYYNIGQTYHAAWYHQKVEVPASWKNQKVMLEIEAPETIATVFANGKPAGTIEWPGGELDLTSHAAPGKPLDLAIHVQANPLSGYYRLGRENFGEKFEIPRLCERRGLSGDVRLYPVTKGPQISGVAIRPSVSKKQLVAVFELANLAPGKSYQIKSAATAAGQIALALPETRFTAKGANDTVEIAAPWENPTLWELSAPYLYDLDATLLDANGKTLDLLWPERFGFREVTANGPDLCINGRPVTLFDASGAISDAPEHAQWCAKYGYTTFYEGEGRENARRLDESGLTSTGERRHMEAVQRAPRDMVKNGRENDPKLWNAIVGYIDYAIKLRRNHPGVIFQRGVLGGQQYENGGLYNPYFQTGTWFNRPFGNELQSKIFDLAFRVKETLHRLDPTRIVTAQDSGSLNDTMHITEYVGFLPIQEAIERTEYWRAHGTKPFLIEEQAAPMYPNWTDACSQGEGWNGVPCFAEWTAITRGDEAFVRTPLDENFLLEMEKSVADARKKVVDTVKDPVQREAALAKIRMQFRMGFYKNQDEVLHNIVWRDRIREEVLNWRANHLGMLGFFFSNGGPRLDLCYQEFQAPVTGFLAGTEAKPALKTHIFAPGETLERGAIFLNNTHKPEELTCKWKLELGGQTAAEGSETRTIPAGRTLFVPIRAKIADGGDRSGKLTVTFVKNGAELRADSCDIDVLAPRAFKTNAAIALIDPEGDSARALEAAGIPFQLRHFDEDLSAFDTVIFGRRAFNYELNMLPEGLDLAQLMAAGKRVLILEQDEAALRDRFKFRTEYVSPRDVYGRIGGSAILDGMSDRCFKFWRGAATLTDGYEVARQKPKPKYQGFNGEFGDGGTWLYKWNDDAVHPRPMKWGNTHNVATVAVIKPDTNNFRTLLDCEYASNYAAAWELKSANGTIVFNQVDVSGRTETGPEAKRYLQNLVRHTAAAPKPVWRKAAYLGGEKGAEFLKQIGVPVSAASEARPDQHLLILGDATAEQLAAWKNGIAAFVQAGGIVFSFPRTEAEFAAPWTPFAVKTAKRTVNHTVIGKPAAPLLAGLGNSDWYWKGNLEITSVQSAEGSDLLLDTGVLASVPYGKGRYVLCQIEPSAFGNIERDHWLKNSKQFTERAIRTLLTNLNVKMDEPKLLARPKASEELDYVLDLSGPWKVCQAIGDTVPAKEDKAWRDIKLPGSPQRAYPEWKGVKGGFWLRREITLDKPLPKDMPVRMIVGCISGSNIVYLNGEKVARTDSETDVNGVATVLRNYTIPEKKFKQGVNEIVLRVDYETNAALGLRGSTGEVIAPMEWRVFKSKTKNVIPEPLALETRSECWGLAVTDPNAPCPNLNTTGTTLPWHRIAVPGMIQPQQADWANFSGWFWYWKPFTLKEPLPDEAQPVLVIGAVDDEDTVYFNGTKIGHTGQDTNPKDYWKVPRHYPIQKNLFRAGQNLIQIQVHDLNNGGGIPTGPFRILFEPPEVTQKRKLADRPYLYDVGRKDDPYWHHGF